MQRHAELKELQEKILILKKTAEELRQGTGGFPALARNTARILASIKMLELNLSDVVESGLCDEKADGEKPSGAGKLSGAAPLGSPSP